MWDAHPSLACIFISCLVLILMTHFISGKLVQVVVTNGDCGGGGRKVLIKVLISRYTYITRYIRTYLPTYLCVHKKI